MKGLGTLMWHRQACCNLQVAEAAVCVLHALLVRVRVRADTKRVLCHAVIAADLHQPLLALLHAHPTCVGSSKVPPLPASLSVHRPSRAPGLGLQESRVSEELMRTSFPTSLYKYL